MTLQQFGDIAQRSIARALGDRRPLAGGEFSVKAIEQAVEDFDLPLVHGCHGPVLRISDQRDR